MPTIRESTPSAQWRRDMLPANFDGFPFHVLQNARESGRRIAMHEFPKKEIPYAEDMGHTAVAFTVQGYIIVYPNDAPGQGNVTMYRRDYRVARDALQERLDRGGPGVLQLPTFIRSPMIVVCTRYRLSEESKAGGYCIFDMQFVERGKRPFMENVDSQGDLYAKSVELRNRIASVWAAEIAKSTPQLMERFNPLVRSGKKVYHNRWNPLVRFIGPPRKLGPIKPGVTSPKSEFTNKSTSKASQQMEMWQTGRA